MFGPPRNRDAALTVLREAVASGVNHIDTSDFYGPHITNQLIREALSPYPDDLVLVTKIGARRGEDASWIRADKADELTRAVEDNLRNLGLDVLDVVNLRISVLTQAPAGSHPMTWRDTRRGRQPPAPRLTAAHPVRILPGRY